MPDTHHRCFHCGDYADECRCAGRLPDTPTPTEAMTIEFIQRAHAGQTDKAGQPYWHHPVAVMRRLGNDGGEVEKLVALLHDVIEDTHYTAVDLAAMGYSREVVEAVCLLSRPKGEGRPTYMDWIRQIVTSGNLTAIRVKIADNEENSDPARIAQLPPESRDIVRRYERSLRILRAAASRQSEVRR